MVAKLLKNAIAPRLSKAEIALEEYYLEMQAKRYIELYQQVLRSWHSQGKKRCGSTRTREIALMEYFIT